MRKKAEKIIEKKLKKEAKKKLEELKVNKAQQEKRYKKFIYLFISEYLHRIYTSICKIAITVCPVHKSKR